MSKIKLIRTSQRANSLRDYDIYIDNELSTGISNGEEKTINLKPGKHTIYAKIDWCKSKELSVELKSEETQKLICGSMLTGWKMWLALFYLFIKNKYVFLDYYKEGQKIDYGEKIEQDPKEKGIFKFVLKTGIIRWGLPVGFFVFLINLLIRSNNLTIDKILSLFFINMFFFAIGGIVFGLVMWFFIKRK